MSTLFQTLLSQLRRRCAVRDVVLACLLVPCGVVSAASPPARLPETALGRIGAALITHVNTDRPEALRAWLPTQLSSALGAREQAQFVEQLVSAARDSGGVEVIDVGEPPGLLVLTLKARRAPRWALLVLGADPKQPSRLAQAELVASDDPALYAAWPRTAVSHEKLAALIRSTLDQWARNNDFSGCVSVLAQGRTVFDECRGLAERSFGVAVDRQTRFHVGSINKMFTAVAIAQLVEAGKLSWDTTLAKAVPEYPDAAAARAITVWQLLHHTAGLGDYLVPEYFQQRERYVQPADYLELIARQPRTGVPGAAWSYSNAGYMLLGRIIEKASGERYADYIQRHVFAPAGMHDSGFDNVEDVVPKLAVGYFRDGVFARDWKAAWLKVGYQAGPAGGGYSTNADLLRFAQALRAGTLLTPATLTRMFKDGVPAGPGLYLAGFGERVAHGRHIRGHAGGIEGTDANLQVVWETGAAVALTSNQGYAESWMLAERVADLLAMSAAAP